MTYYIMLKFIQLVILNLILIFRNGKLVHDGGHIMFTTMISTQDGRTTMIPS